MEGDQDVQVLPDIPEKKIKIEKPTVHMDDWLQDVICTGEETIESVDMIKQEIARYLGSAISVEAISTDKTNDKNKCVILEWWKKNEIFYPRLSILARKYLCIPASSIPSERIFSLCGTLVSKKRSRLSPSKVGLLVFLNKNLEHFW